MCRGNSMTKNTQDPLRRCIFLHHKNVYLKLAPFKVNIVSEKPLISRVYNFLSLEETHRLKDQGQACLKPRIYNSNEGVEDLHHFTAKEICYIHYKNGKNLRKIREF